MVRPQTLTLTSQVRFLCSRQNKLEVSMDNIVQKGWECPKCGAVMAPFKTSCVNCTGHIYVTASSSGLGNIDKHLNEALQLLQKHNEET